MLRDLFENTMTKLVQAYHSLTILWKFIKSKDTSVIVEPGRTRFGPFNPGKNDAKFAGPVFFSKITKY